MSDGVDDSCVAVAAYNILATGKPIQNRELLLPWVIKTVNVSGLFDKQVDHNQLDRVLTRLVELELLIVVPIRSGSDTCLTNYQLVDPMRREVVAYGHVIDDWREWLVGERIGGNRLKTTPSTSLPQTSTIAIALQLQGVFFELDPSFDGNLPQSKPTEIIPWKRCYGIKGTTLGGIGK